jgi:ligand-binding SRPBCC domain-containing protein
MQETSITISPDAKAGYRLKAVQWFDLPLEQVFSFFSDAMELERITPGFLQFKVLTPPPINIQEGTLLDYRLKLHGIPIKWRTEICVWEPPFRFVDQQLRGPYRRWYHEHQFEEIDGKTRVLDDVHYIPRGGSLIHNFLVKPDLEKIFGFRQDRLREIFDEKKARLSRSDAAIHRLMDPETQVSEQSVH